MLEESRALREQGAGGAVPLQEPTRGALGIGKQTSLPCSVSPAPPTNTASPVSAGMGELPEGSCSVFPEQAERVHVELRGNNLHRSTSEASKKR